MLFGRSKLKTRLLFILLLLVTMSAAFAGVDLSADLKPAQQALASGDYRTAYSRYARFATSNPLAQLTLGLFHHNGWGRPVDEVAACRWFEKSARHKIPAAQHYLGDCLVKGIHRAANPEAALDLYRDAAASGHLISLCSAADLYIKGQGVAKDVKLGLELCAQAAQTSSPPAMLRLADYLQQGTDVPQDLAAARYWYQQAAERQVAEAQYQLGRMLAGGLGGEADLGVALLWLETAAAEGYAPAYLPTAILYANASVQPDTGALAPEHLAKIYLWLMAAKARNTDPAQGEEIGRVEAQVLAVMPAGWRPELDKKVATHLARFPH
jgi:TPR repeat protein